VKVHVIDKASPALEKIRAKLPKGAKTNLRRAKKAAALIQRYAKRIPGKLRDEISQSIKIHAGTTTGAVIVKHPAAYQREYGGTIRPVEGETLSIPIKPGTKPRSGMFRVKSKSRDPNTVGVLGIREGDAFIPLFVLRTEVTQHARPWFPTLRTLGEAVQSEEMQMLREAGI